jgi:hypothetical protein
MGAAKLVYVCVQVEFLPAFIIVIYPFSGRFPVPKFHPASGKPRPRAGVLKVLPSLQQIKLNRLVWQRKIKV